jgi:chloramphenicol-sensitive protein RarD
LTEAQKGVLFGLGAFGAWGITPIFWNLVDDIDSTDMLLHRIVWSLPLLIVVVVSRKRLREFRDAFKSRRTIGLVALAGTLLITNWTVWLWSITNERIIEASLGYFITPLVSVALGVVILGERLRRLQWVAVGVASIGVIGMAISVGSAPWVALWLASTFGLYGLVKKRPEVPAPLISLAGEMLVMFIPAVIVLVLFHHPSGSQFGDSAPLTAFLLVTSFVTVGPLLLFGAAAKRVPLTMLGLLQYLAPTLQLIVGVWFYNEVLSAERLGWFGVVWIALAIYTYDSLSTAKTQAASAKLPA